MNFIQAVVYFLSLNSARSLSNQPAARNRPPNCGFERAWVTESSGDRQLAEFSMRQPIGVWQVRQVQV